MVYLVSRGGNMSKNTFREAAKLMTKIREKAFNKRKIDKLREKLGKIQAEYDKELQKENEASYCHNCQILLKEEYFPDVENDRYKFCWLCYQQAQMLKLKLDNLIKLKKLDDIIVSYKGYKYEE